MGNQGKGKNAWKGSAKSPFQKKRSASRSTNKISKNFSNSKTHHDSLKGNRGNRQSQSKGSHYCEPVLQNMHKQFLTKQAKTRFYGNLYLHLISELFFKFLIDQLILNYLDIEFLADNYDGIVVFSFSNSKIDISKIIDNFIISENDILRAITRISCDKKRQIIYDLESITKDINILHQTSWLESNITKRVRPETTQSKGHNFYYQKRTLANFSCYNIYINISNFKEDHLKPLASAILSILSLALDPFIYSHPTHIGYIDKEQYSDYQLNSSYIGIKKQISFPRQFPPKANELKKYLEKSFLKIKNQNLSKKIHDNLDKTQTPPISVNDLFTSSGFIVTPEYWQNLSLKNIEKIISLISFSVEKCQN